MPKKKNPPLPIQAAYSKFEAAREALISFRKRNEAVLDEYDSIVSQYNDSFDAVKEMYKKYHEEIGSRLGDFKCRVNREVDLERLLELVPAAEALVKTVSKLDLEEYRKAVSKGHIPQEVVAEVETEGTVVITGPRRP